VAKAAKETKATKAAKVAKPAKVVKPVAPPKSAKPVKRHSVAEASIASKDPKPQKLVKIEIHGFKSIESTSLELRDLNVVIGANGAGKSNLIGAFKLLERYFSNRLSDHIAGEPERFLHHGPKVTSGIKLELVFERFAYGFTIQDMHGTTIECTGVETRRIPPMVPDTTHPDYLPLRDLMEYVRYMTQKCATYHFDDTTDLTPAKRLANLGDNRFLRPDGGNLAAFLYWMQEKEPVRFRMVEEHIRLVAPFFECFVLAPFKLNENKIKLEWRQKGSNAYFDGYSLSSGTLRFICLAALLLQPEPPPLILLDEPELGLHPLAIRVLAEMLESASMRSQVIIATQSVTLLDRFRPDCVVVAEHDGSKTAFRRLDEKKLAAWLEDYSLGELFEKNVLGGRP